MLSLSAECSEHHLYLEGSKRERSAGPLRAQGRQSWMLGDVLVFCDHEQRASPVFSLGLLPYCWHILLQSWNYCCHRLLECWG